MVAAAGVGVAQQRVYDTRQVWTLVRGQVAQVHCSERLVSAEPRWVKSAEAGQGQTLQAAAAALEQVATPGSVPVRSESLSVQVVDKAELEQLLLWSDE